LPSSGNYNTVDLCPPAPSWRSPGVVNPCLPNSLTFAVNSSILSYQRLIRLTVTDSSYLLSLLELQLLHPPCGTMALSARKTKTAATAATAAATAIAGHPNNAGKSKLEHVITEILKQPTGGTLAQALDRAGISEVFDLLILSQPNRDSFTFVDTDGLVTPLPLGL